MSNQVLVFGSTLRESGREDISLDSTTTNPGFVHPPIVVRILQSEMGAYISPHDQQGNVRDKVEHQEEYLKDADEL